MKKEFFTFWPKHLNRELQIEPVMKYYSYKLLEKTDPIISNSKYTIKKGSKQFDIVTYLNWSQFLISEKFKNILDRNGFNGYECFPAEIVGLSSKYYGWLNINEVGPIIRENTNTHIVWFDLRTWKNYDIFHLKDTYMNVCTKEVKEAVEGGALTNIEFCPCYGTWGEEPPVL